MNSLCGVCELHVRMRRLLLSEVCLKDRQVGGAKTETITTFNYMSGGGGGGGGEILQPKAKIQSCFFPPL